MAEGNHSAVDATIEAGGTAPPQTSVGESRTTCSLESGSEFDPTCRSVEHTVGSRSVERESATISTMDSASQNEALSEDRLHRKKSSHKKHKKEKKEKKKSKKAKKEKRSKRDSTEHSNASSMKEPLSAADELEGSMDGVPRMPLSSADELETSMPLSELEEIRETGLATAAVASSAASKEPRHLLKSETHKELTSTMAKPALASSRPDLHTTTTTDWKKSPSDTKSASLAAIMAEQEAQRSEVEAVQEQPTGAAHEMDSEEDRMVRMAMELSLKEFKIEEERRKEWDSVDGIMTATPRRLSIISEPGTARRSSIGSEPETTAVIVEGPNKSEKTRLHKSSISLPAKTFAMPKKRTEPSLGDLGVRPESQDVPLSPRSQGSAHKPDLRMVDLRETSDPDHPSALSSDCFQVERITTSDSQKESNGPKEEEKPKAEPTLSSFPSPNIDPMSQFFHDKDSKNDWFDDDDPKAEWFDEFEMGANFFHTGSDLQTGGTGETGTARQGEQPPDASSPEGSQQPSQARRMSLRQSRRPSIQEITASGHITKEEAEQIEKALREADELEYRKNYSLAVRLQDEEAQRFLQNSQTQQQQQRQGNVRTMTRAEYERSLAADIPTTIHVPDEEAVAGDSGFRMNASKPSQNWERRDRNSVIGPNNEVRTKHDAELQAISNVHRLGLDDKDDVGFVGNKAFNSFRQSMQRQTVKGVAAHGHGRATADTDRTSGGMDSRVRHHIAHAINKELIEKCNGVINEGKEAVIYHAIKGKESEGFDVAIKVFKRIKEFRGRGDYVEGDPRYAVGEFRKACSREQVELWAEKEHRNLVRASKAGVPVPSPLFHKENIVFMRFLGEDGWAVPQLKELKLRRGSAKWATLYSQVMVATRRLFRGAKLVHADLSEYNILVSPARLVENCDDTIDPDDDQALQAVLIDLGQAVDYRHPSAMEYLERDLTRVRDFFSRMGIKTLDLQRAVDFVTTEDHSDQNAVESHGTGASFVSSAKTSSSKEHTSMQEPRNDQNGEQNAWPASAFDVTWTADFENNDFFRKDGKE